MEVSQKDTITKKVLFTIFIIILIRLGNFIPVPNVDQRYLVNILNANPSLKAFFNTETLILSVFSLGILPNINASILIQLLVSAVPYLEKLPFPQFSTPITLIFFVSKATILFSFNNKLNPISLWMLTMLLK